jgi:hypothetical protein
MVYAGVEVMDLEGELALEDVQSYQREGAEMAVAVFADVGALHKAQVDFEDIASGLPGGPVGTGSGPLDKSHTNVAVEIGDYRGVVLGRIGAASGRITGQEDVVDGCAWAEGLYAAGDRPGAASVCKCAAFEGKSGAKSEGVEADEFEEISSGEGSAE